MTEFFTLLISGAVSGAVYSLVGSGLVLSYSASGIFNFLYGAVAFTTAFLYYQLHTALHMPVLPAAVLSILVFAPLLGIVLDRLIFRRLSEASEAAKIIATVGVLTALPALALWLVQGSISVFHWPLLNGNNVVFPSSLGPVPKHNFHITGTIIIDSNQLIILVAAVVCALFLWVILRRTRLGLVMRATVDRRWLAELRGVDPRRVSTVASTLGVLLAGLAGVIGAPVFSLAPANYVDLVFIGATAAVLGGLRSIPLAFVGGLILGIAENLVAGYATFAQSIAGFGTSVPFVLLLLGLLFSSRARLRRAGTSSDEVAPANYAADLPRWRQVTPWIAGVVFFIAYVLFLANDFWLGLVAQGLALSLIFLSWVIVTGIGGMVSLAQSAFVTTAALVAGLLISHNVAFGLAIVAGAAAAAVAGVIVALPALRLGGLPLALATLALALIADAVLFNWDALSNGQYGWSILPPVLGPLNLQNPQSLALFLLALVGIATLLIRNLQRSPSGRAMVAVRSSEAGAASAGISPTGTKLILFAASAALAGIGGVMLATVSGNITNASYPPELGLYWLLIVVIFGIRRPGYAVVAGIVAATSPQIIGWYSATSSPYIPQILAGLGAMGLAANPDGFINNYARQQYLRRQKKRAQTTPGVVTGVLRDDLGEEPDRAKISAPASSGGGSKATSLSRVQTAASVGRSEDRAGSLVVDDLCAGYGELQVLHNVDLVVRPESIVALLGANGAGKSTLCSVVSGLLPATSGRIMFNGEDVTTVSAHERARRRLLLAPEARGIFPGLTVEENLAVSIPSPRERMEVYEHFPILGERRNLVASSLSGGEQQMLTLSALLVKPPLLLVADEPTLGLAPLIVQQILSVLRELRERGVAILLVEEKPQDVLTIADNVTFLELGRVVWSGLPEELDDDRLAASYLGASVELSE